MSGFQSRTHNARLGATYLEVQVAMVLLSIGISGLYSLSVIQTRQTARLEQLLPVDEIASINPVSGSTPKESDWIKKLGVYADIQPNAVAAPETIYPLNYGFRRVIDNEDWSRFTTYEAPGSAGWHSYGGYPYDYWYDTEELEINGSSGSYAEYVFDNVPTGDYEVLVYSFRDAQFGTAVTHEVYDGSFLIDSVPVDQTVDPDDLYTEGRWWNRLGSYRLTGHSVRVRITDTAPSGYYIVADAVMLRCRQSYQVVSPVQHTSDGGATVTLELN